MVVATAVLVSPVAGVVAVAAAREVEPVTVSVPPIAALPVVLRPVSA